MYTHAVYWSIYLEVIGKARATMDVGRKPRAVTCDSLGCDVGRLGIFGGLPFTNKKRKGKTIEIFLFSSLFFFSSFTLTPYLLILLYFSTLKNPMERRRSVGRRRGKNAPFVSPRLENWGKYDVFFIIIEKPREFTFNSRSLEIEKIQGRREKRRGGGSCSGYIYYVYR